MADDAKALISALRNFAREREWDQFHAPKNLAAALSVEAAELLEHFQWISEDQSRHLSDEKKQEVAQELADVFLYLLQLSDKLDVDLYKAAWLKLEANAAKYPVERAKGSSKKYTEI